MSELYTPVYLESRADLAERPTSHSRQLAISLFADESSTTPTEAKTTTWSAIVSLLRKRQIRPRKSGPMLGGYAVVGTRSNANVPHRSLVQLDIDTLEITNATDKSSTRTRCLQLIQSHLSPISDFEWVVTSTHSHDPTTGKLKCRVTILPDRDIQPSEYPSVLTALNDRLGGILDTNAWQWSQAFFLPSCPRDAEPYAFFGHNPGIAMPVDALVAEGQHKQGLPTRNRSLTPLARALSSNLHSGPHETTENVTRAKTALTALDPGMPRAQWLTVIWAVNAHGWQCGYEMARTWSSQSSKFDPATFDKDWESFEPHRPNGINSASLYYLAKESGWHDPVGVTTEPGDIANSRRFADQHRGNLAFVHPARKWIQFDGRRWMWCEAREEMAAAKATADSILDEAATCIKRDPNNPTHKRLWTHARRSQDERRLLAMVSLASCEQGASVSSVDQLDRDPWLLNVANGVIDLRAGSLLAHDPAMMLTRICSASYRPRAACPRWLQFLDEIFCGDADLVEYIQRALGYSLTGLVSEEVLFFMFGYGANGKSVFINVVYDVLNDYAVTAPASMLSLKRNEDGGRATPELAKLVGARFAVANETQSGERLDEQMVKVLVSRERITARHLYAHYFEFRPTHALWVRGNHKPIITGDDYGIWRRIHLIPFQRTFTPADADPSLEAALLKERDGILSWMIEGCLKWQRDGLKVPPAVEGASREYRKESDVLGQWIDDCCDIDPAERTEQSRVYNSYRDWCKDGNFRAMAKAQFTRKIAERGISTNGWIGKTRAYVGLRLKHMVV